MHLGTALALAVLRVNLRFLHYGTFGASGRNDGPGGAPSRVAEMTAMGAHQPLMSEQRRKGVSLGA